MHFSTLAVPFVAMAAAVQGQTVKVYSDAACKKQIQTITMNNNGNFQCVNLQNQNAKSVILSTQGFNSPYRGFNAWDSQYCDGNAAGGSPKQLGKCLAAADFGLLSWKSVHISPRNPGPPPGVPQNGS